MLPFDLGSTLHGPTSPGSSEWEARGLPQELVRVLTAANGARSGDLQFLSLSQVEPLREAWDARRAQVDAGTSTVPSHALWGLGWYPIAQTSTELFAYAPRPCFRGPPGQVVGFDVERGTSWEVCRSLALWLGALDSGSAGQDVIAEARRWLAARGRLLRVDAQGGHGALTAPGRFELPPAVVIEADAEREQVDVTLLVLHALSARRAPNEVLGDVARALDAAVPFCNLERLAEAELDDAGALGRTWLRPSLAAQASNPGATHLVFDLEHRPSGFFLWMVAGAAGRTATGAERVKQGTPFLRALGALVATPEVGHSVESWQFARASAALLIPALLDEAAPVLPWQEPMAVMLGQTQLGRCDRDFFVPTPLAMARSQLASMRAGSAAGLERMDFPGRPPRFIDAPVPEAAERVRRLRHADGRSIDVVIGPESFEWTTVEADGERDTSTRPLKTGWELETRLTSRLRAGFVDV